MRRMAKKRSSDRHAPNRTVRIPETLYRELEELARETERPVHWEARIAIREHIARHRLQQTQQPPEAKPS